MADNTVILFPEEEGSQSLASSLDTKEQKAKEEDAKEEETLGKEAMEEETMEKPPKYSLPKDKDDRERLDPIPGLPPDLSEEMVGCPFAPRCPHCSDLCREQMPAVRELAGGRSVRCHYADEMLTGGARHGE